MARDEDQYRVSRLGERQRERPEAPQAEPRPGASTAKPQEQRARPGSVQAPRTKRPDQFRQGGVLERFVKKIQQQLESRGIPQPLQLRIRTDAETKMLSGFELKIIERFVEEKPVAGESPDGQPHFLQKTAQQWKSFFQQFLHRTVKKVAPLDILQQMIFRGVVQKKGVPDSGLLIGDLAFAGGEIDKFARFEVALHKVQTTLASLTPGAVLTPEEVARGIAGDEMQYFAIAPARYGGEDAPAQQQTAGIFTSLRTEQVIAERLGFPETDARRLARARGDAAEAPATDDSAPPARFVPWWRWDREARLGLRRWFVPVALLTLVVVLGIVVWVMVD